MILTPASAAALVRGRARGAGAGRRCRAACCARRPPPAAAARSCARPGRPTPDAPTPLPHDAAQVPKVLSSRFHATATTRAPLPEPPAKRQRRGGGAGGGGASDGGASSGGGGGGASSGDDGPWPGAAGGGAAAPHLSVFRTFPTQSAAFEFWDSQAPGTHLLRAFAVEHDASGRRAFIIAAPERFWAEYKALPHTARNHYEVRGRAGGGAGGSPAKRAAACARRRAAWRDLCPAFPRPGVTTKVPARPPFPIAQIIRERCPCHLYFDLEFVPALNPRLDGNGLVRLLVDEVAEALRVRGGAGVAGWRAGRRRGPAPAPDRAAGAATPAGTARPLQL
jgi:hypothetical protein